MNELMRKYVIVQERPECPERLAVFSGHLQHKSMVPAGCVAVSAGFVLLCGGAVVVSPIGSESLRLGPRAGDRSMISSFLGL